ncbi:MAG: hypothetical protein FD143_3032 [Ignavibacteria bacterium]|nr:MAG: hypothetical protein FD143_3032 [Ignavibacteria bacterium]
MDSNILPAFTSDPSSILIPTCNSVTIDIAPCACIPLSTTCSLSSSLFVTDSQDYSKFLESINIFVEKCSWNQLMQIAKIINNEVLGRGEGVVHPMLGYF